MLAKAGGGFSGEIYRGDTLPRQTPLALYLLVNVRHPVSLLPIAIMTQFILANADNGEQVGPSDR